MCEQPTKELRRKRSEKRKSFCVVDESEAGEGRGMGAGEAV